MFKINYMKRVLLLLIFPAMFFGISNAQDLHYSQFYNSALNLNPALTGIFNGDVRAMANYKNQWSSVPVPYMTFTGAADMKIYNKRNEYSFFSGGLLFDYDQAGDSQLSLASLGVSGAYTLPVSSSMYFTLGGMVGFANRNFKTVGLQFSSQWDGDRYDPGLATNEPPGTSTSFLDLAGGANIRWQKSSRTHLDVGLGAFHLNRPNQAFYDGNEAKIPMRISLHGISSFQVAESIDLILNAMHQIQGPYDETVLNAQGKIYLNKNKGKELTVYLGGGIRLGDAFYPKFAVEYNNLYVGLNYDINYSDFSHATNGRGGPEIAVRYIITKVKPLSTRVCPIF